MCAGYDAEVAQTLALLEESLPQRSDYRKRRMPIGVAYLCPIIIVLTVTTIAATYAYMKTTDRLAKTIQEKADLRNRLVDISNDQAEVNQILSNKFISTDIRLSRLAEIVIKNGDNVFAVEKMLIPITEFSRGVNSAIKLASQGMISTSLLTKEDQSDIVRNYTQGIYSQTVIHAMFPTKLVGVSSEKKQLDFEIKIPMYSLQATYIYRSKLSYMKKEGEDIYFCRTHDEYYVANAHSPADDQEFWDNVPNGKKGLLLLDAIGFIEYF